MDLGLLLGAALAMHSLTSFVIGYSFVEYPMYSLCKTQYSLCCRGPLPCPQPLVALPSQPW
jgi:hypothetical protein